MRISRSIQLWPQSASVHLFWRCHNNEPILEANETKDLYLKCIKESLERVNGRRDCRIHSFGILKNRVHQTLSYFGGSSKLSALVKITHSLLGARFNRLTGRSGRVVNGRPKTSLIQNEEFEMKVHVYIESQPLREGLCTLEDLGGYLYSSYGYYAFGNDGPLRSLLTAPDWYLRLGASSEERQSRYRELFAHMLGDLDSVDLDSFSKAFIGTGLWTTLSQMSAKELYRTLQGKVNR